MSKQKPKSKSRRPVVDYDNRRDGRWDANAPPDDRTLNDIGRPVNLVRPYWEKGPLVFVPGPYRSYDEPDTFLPGRVAAANLGQSEWIIRVLCAPYIGLPGADQHFTFCMSAPRDKEAKANNPYQVFYSSCDSAFKAYKEGTVDISAGRVAWDAQSWNPLINPKKGGASIKEPAFKYFIQGGVFVNGETDYMEDRSDPFGYGKDDDLTVIQLAISAGLSLNGLLDTRKESWNGDEETHPWLPFYYGDAIGIYDEKTDSFKRGLVITAFNPKVTKTITEYTSWDGEIAINQGYEIALNRAFKHGEVSYQGGMTAEQLARWRERSHYWWDTLDEDNNEEPGLIRIAPIEQQAEWVAMAYGDAGRLVAFAWARHPEFFTDSVKGILAKRVAFVIPGLEEEDQTEEPEAAAAPAAGTRTAKPAARPAGKKPAKPKKDVTQPPLPFEEGTAGDEFAEEQDAGAAPVSGEDEFGDEPEAAQDEFGNETEVETAVEDQEPEEDEFGNETEVEPEGEDQEPEEDEFAEGLPPKPAARPAAKPGKPATTTAADDDLGGFFEDTGDRPAAKPAAKPATGTRPAVKPKPAAAEDPEVRDARKKKEMAASMAAAKAAEGRSTQRTSSAKPPPKPPPSRGGTARRK